jgi:ketosteroid isomerase-like protein
MSGSRVSKYNVEVVRRVLALAERARASGVLPQDTDLVAPDAEIDMSRRVFNPDTYRGLDGWVRLNDELREVWDEWRVIPERFIEAGDRVVVFVTIRARGRGSGVALEVTESAEIWTLRDGQVTRVEIGLDPQEALKAVGLEE